jgi:hypothetical protein
VSTPARNECPGCCGELARMPRSGRSEPLLCSRCRRSFESMELDQIKEERQLAREILDGYLDLFNKDRGHCPRCNSNDIRIQYWDNDWDGSPRSKAECKGCGLGGHYPGKQSMLHQYFQDPNHETRTRNVVQHDIWQKHLERLREELRSIRAAQKIDPVAEFQKTQESLVQANRARAEELRRKYKKG